MALLPRSVTVTVDKLAAVGAAVTELAKTRVLVGIPSEKSPRADDEINSAALLYIHEHGAPEAGIPARPTLYPGLKDARDKTNALLGQAGTLALSGDAAASGKAFAAAGMVGRDAVKNRIGSNTPPPLAPSTLAARRRRGVTRTNTLIDTAAMQGAVTYVVRKE